MGLVRVQVRGFGMMNGTFGLGLIVGPIVGGLLSRPAIQYPSTFSRTGIWGRLPYLLPCLVCALIAGLAVIAIGLWVPETLGDGVRLCCALPGAVDRAAQVAGKNSLCVNLKSLFVVFLFSRLYLPHVLLCYSATLVGGDLLHFVGFSFYSKPSLML